MERTPEATVNGIKYALDAGIRRAIEMRDYHAAQVAASQAEVARWEGVLANLSAVADSLKSQPQPQPEEEEPITVTVFHDVHFGDGPTYVLLSAEDDARWAFNQASRKEGAMSKQVVLDAMEWAEELAIRYSSRRTLTARDVQVLRSHQAVLAEVAAATAIGDWAQAYELIERANALVA